MILTGSDIVVQSLIGEYVDKWVGDFEESKKMVNML